MVTVNVGNNSTLILLLTGKYHISAGRRKKDIRIQVTFQWVIGPNTYSPGRILPLWRLWSQEQGPPIWKVPPHLNSPSQLMPGTISSRCRTSSLFEQARRRVIHLGQERGEFSMRTSRKLIVVVVDILFRAIVSSFSTICFDNVPSEPCFPQ